jgi:HPt (histidine-containing phosphotransfer) domain-containing protein
MKIDEDHLWALAGDDHEMVAEIVKDFCEVSLGLVGQMKAALSGDDGDGLNGFLHQLKGSSGTLGMVSLFERSRDLEVEDLEFWQKQGEERFEELENGIRESTQLALNCLAG